MTRFSKQWIQHNQVMLYAVAVFLAIATGLGQPDAGSVLEPLINPVLAVLIKMRSVNSMPPKQLGWQTNTTLMTPFRVVRKYVLSVGLREHDV